MGYVSKTIWVLLVGCIVISNMLGKTMARRLQRASSVSYWPTAGNKKLAKDYHALFGSDGNYRAYCFLNLATLIGIVTWAIYSLFG